MLAPLRPPIAINLDQIEAKILGRLAGMHWYTLIIEPGAWRRVAERADEMGYATYCPMKREAIPAKPGFKFVSRVVERPLMPGYLFVDMPGPRRRFDLFQAPTDSAEGVQGSWGFIALDGGPVALHEAVIEDMRLREKNGEFDLTGKTDDGRGFVAKWVRVGAWVQVLSGPFASFFGVIEEVASATMIKVGVHIFGRVTPIGMSPDYVRIARTEDHGVLISRKNHAKRRTSVSGRDCV